MKAVFIEEQGGRELMRYGDLPNPTPGPREVLVRVRATALNRRDVFAREGSHGVRPPLPSAGTRPRPASAPPSISARSQ